MSARVVFIGLDAAEPDLLRAGAESGALPTLGGLGRRGASAALDNCMLTLPGAVWPEIASGVSCGKLPRFFHPRQVITGEAAPRPLRVSDVSADPTFWNTAGVQGQRVAIVDIPHTPLAPGINGVQVVEYGMHDYHFGRASHPAPLIDELSRTHGAYPIHSCDHYGGSTASHLRLFDDLLEGIERKTRLLLDLLARERWDLFACAFSEAHCGGHWFWHYRDEGHWGFAGDAPLALRNAVRTIYEKLDASVGRIVEAAGADTTIVVASHGMAPFVAGFQLLPEVLARLGLGSSPPGQRSVLRNLQYAAQHWVPRRYWEDVRRIVIEHPVARAIVGPVQRSSGATFCPLELPETRAVSVPNNTVGAIRFNLRGREPFGRVEPGDEAAALAEDIRAELLALRQPGSGQPIVAHVATADEVFGNAHHPDAPDIMVTFRRDLGLLESCESPRIGRVHVPVGSRWGRRTGDHSPRSAVWLEAAGVPPGAACEPASLLDIAPTILAALGCELPPVLDGRPLRTRGAAGPRPGGALRPRSTSDTVSAPEEKH